jgi:hypothetical protein
MILELDKAIFLKQKIILIIKNNLVSNKKFSNFLNNFDEIHSFQKNITEIKTLD